MLDGPRPLRARVPVVLISLLSKIQSAREAFHEARDISDYRCRHCDRVWAGILGCARVNAHAVRGCRKPRNYHHVALLRRDASESRARSVLRATCHRSGHTQGYRARVVDWCGAGPSRGHTRSETRRRECPGLVDGGCVHIPAARLRLFRVRQISGWRRHSLIQLDSQQRPYDSDHQALPGVVALGVVCGATPCGCACVLTLAIGERCSPGPSYAANTAHVLWPPKPNALLIATRILRRSGTL